MTNRTVASSALIGIGVLLATACAAPQPNASVREQPASASVRESPTSSASAPAGLPVPRGWQPVSVRREHHDERSVTVTRYQAERPPRPGGEHVSTVIDDRGTLLGYTRMVAGGPTGLLDQGQAEERALRWLRGTAPDYADGLSVDWVNRHDETVTDADGAEHVISGMKVKLHHDSGRYAWVVLDGDGQVITYERDIRWDSSAGRRGTEMWLHDKWIAAREGTGPQPDPPYAVAG